MLPSYVCAGPEDATGVVNGELLGLRAELAERAVGGAMDGFGYYM